MGETVRKKWSSMRDYFVRSMKKKSTGSAAQPSNRDESLMFLYNTSVVQRPSISSLPIEILDISDSSNTATTSTESPRPKKPKLDHNEVLRDLIASRPKPSDFFPQVDETQQFFDTIASTVKKFDAVTIAKIKIQIANIVGEEEIKWAEKQNKNK